MDYETFFAEARRLGWNPAPDDLATMIRQREEITALRARLAAAEEALVIVTRDRDSLLSLVSTREHVAGKISAARAGERDGWRSTT